VRVQHTSPKIPAAVRCDIEALVNEYAWRIDHGHADRLHELYTDDGCFEALDIRCIGRKELQRWGVARAQMQHRTTRHVFTNMRLLFDGEDRICGTVIITLYRRDSAPLGPADLIAVGDYNDVYVRSNGEWLIHERKLNLIFQSTS
jgi:hypothetical protein